MEDHVASIDYPDEGSKLPPFTFIVHLAREKVCFVTFCVRLLACRRHCFLTASLSHSESVVTLTLTSQEELAVSQSN